MIRRPLSAVAVIIALAAAAASTQAFTADATDAAQPAFSLPTWQTTPAAAGATAVPAPRLVR